MIDQAGGEDGRILTRSIFIKMPKKKKRKKKEIGQRHSHNTRHSHMTRHSDNTRHRHNHMAKKLFSCGNKLSRISGARKQAGPSRPLD